jgi:hypothetical protein
MEHAKKMNFYKVESKAELKEFLTKDLKIIEDMDIKDALLGSYKIFSKNRPLKSQIASLKTGVLTPIYYIQTAKKKDGGVVKLRHEWVYVESTAKRDKTNDSLKSQMKEFESQDG